ncbi:MAG TPA: HAD family hydrolase [Candidatus Eisenbergiella intestinipullorum]|nr:HAD family hydrolase [Candidatus Eisenbergiella intestinipullorum]
MKAGMIVTDLDGTLLRDDKTISDFTIGVIKKYQSEGGIFVAATARPVRTAREYMKILNLNAGIFHNGAVIQEKGRKTGGYGVKNAGELAQSILERYPFSNIAVEAEDVLYANFDAGRLWPGAEYISCKTFAQLRGKTADKIIVEVASLSEMEKYKALLPDELYIQLSENKIGMIMNQSATKYHAISFLAERYHISMDDVIAFGDDYNDLEMIEKCGKGIAVSNALEIVKGVADGVCESNQKDGVARWIEGNLL